VPKSQLISSAAHTNTDASDYQTPSGQSSRTWAWARNRWLWNGWKDWERDVI